MRTLLVAFIFCLVSAGGAWAHSDHGKSPTPVQIIQYKNALWMNPDDLETRNKLAMAFYRSNKLEESEEEFMYVLRKEPKNYDALDGFGVLLIRKKNYPEALEYLQRAVKINEQDPMVHVHLSAVYHKLKEQDKAKDAWKRAKSLAKSRTQRKEMEQEFKYVSGR